ncbi:2-hydroxychromene-2-carboxylate isomerase [Sneathiella aquimaris]|uniref:2-hydroxychromene-2-carboxylate isomerase n=1 Tax=Sneathiella aquimaris TaxID=2599305 RepID=UPI00146AEB36|nr:2-hydroxychromene-2-carboxylate isomerase [Sneathiella aquimaris]
MHIDYYYAAHSAYAYLGAAELYRIAKEAGATIVHKPMDLRVVMPASGSMPMTNRSKAHIDYFFNREISRWAEYREIPVMSKIPTHHANEIHLANRLLIAADQTDQDINRLSEEMLRAHWVDDADVASPEDLRKICQTVDIDPEPLFLAVETQSVKNTYEKNTKEAIDLGLFGSPAYIVGNDMFYGQDRLDFVARALKKPFAGKWPID